MIYFRLQEGALLLRHRDRQVSLRSFNWECVGEDSLRISTEADSAERAGMNVLVMSLGGEQSWLLVQLQNRRERDLLILLSRA